jgi:hypothetical protein
MGRLKNSRVSALNETDVDDTDILRRFRNKRSEWFELFESQDHGVQTIQKQLLDAVVLDLNYRVFIEEARQHTAGQGYAVPSLLYLLNVGYVTSQCLIARRMLDTRKDVASLARVLKDVRKHREIITRECFVSYDGTPYEYDLSNTALDGNQQKELAIFGLQGPSFSLQLRSMHRHERFDGLTGMEPSRRSRNNLIDISVFEKLQNWLRSDPALKLKQISDDRFAHATDGSHSQARQLIGDIAPLEIEQAQRGFVRATRGLFDVVLNSEVHGEVVPHMALGSFGTVWSESNLVPSTDRMQKRWDELADNRNSWWRNIEEELRVHIPHESA